MSTSLERDHISNLPRGLISDILSRLPTKDAVKTSVLSHKWKCKWLSIYNIDIDSSIKSSHGSSDQVECFTYIVARILLQTDNSRLRSFRLSNNRMPHFGHLETWISNVLTRNVENLVIIARCMQGFDSPWCFSGWTSLTELRLEMNCTLEVPADNCFPNLKRLFLCSGVRGNLKIMTTKCLDSGRVELIFPVLVFLQLSRCEWLDVNSVEVQAPELLCFTSSCSLELKNYEIKICAPKLAVFELRGRGPVTNYVLSAPAFTYAILSDRFASETSALQVHKILTQLSNLKCLRIHGEALQALLHLKPEFVFPTFNRLKELEINFYCAMKDVLELLHVAPPLELLIINVGTLDEYELAEALTPKIVPQLNEVKLLDFSATKSQYALATFLLENAKNLSRMTVNLHKDALNFKKRTVEDGKPIDIVEVVGQSLSKLKPKGSSCELAVEQKDITTAWSGSTPRIRCIGNKYYVV